MRSERRRSQRHRTREGALAVFSIPGQVELKLGQIGDISTGGLSLIYPGEADPRIEPSFVSGEIELLGHEELPHVLKAIPCRIVYDSLMATDSEITSGMRRCGIEFNRPTARLARLDYFIRNNV
jgi:hypothetical protein